MKPAWYNTENGMELTGLTELKVTYNQGPPESTGHGQWRRAQTLPQNPGSGSAAGARHGTWVDGGTESKVCDRDHKADSETRLNLPENTYKRLGTPACHRRPQNGNDPHRVGMPQARVRPAS